MWDDKYFLYISFFQLSVLFFCVKVVPLFLASFSFVDSFSGQLGHIHFWWVVIIKSENSPPGRKEYIFYFCDSWQARISVSTFTFHFFISYCCFLAISKNVYSPPSHPETFIIYLDMPLQLLFLVICFALSFPRLVLVAIKELRQLSCPLIVTRIVIN